MVKCLNRNERDFKICSDCIHFEFVELIDENYPDIKRGRCKLTDNIVDNRWGTDCEQCEDMLKNCVNCKYVYYDEDCDCVCSKTGSYVDQYDNCELFEDLKQ